MDGSRPQDPADGAIARMRSPRDMHIICVDVTNKCDLKCSNCTRLLVNQSRFWDMTPDNFRLALRSLKDFTGVIAMIGGNPCMHKDFPELCQVFVEEVPVKRQRGLWSNNVFDHQELIRDTFGFFNLNPHNDKRSVESLEKLKKLIPNIQFYSGNSHHAPLMTAMRDLYPDEGEMWAKIQDCDINREWSASIVQNKGELRAYFCEVAASFDLARGGDHGAPVIEGWWQKGIADYSDQVKRFCPGCGVPARLKGTLDADETDSYTKSNADIATKTRRKRAVIEIDGAGAEMRSDRHVTDYSEQHKRAPEFPDAPPVSVVIPFYNANGTIRETVGSALAQRDVECEIIIVDDCSPEDPREGLAELAEGLTIIRNARNSGPATARNAGLARARGKYVCFLDADDVYADGFFAEAVEYLESHPDVMAVTTGVELLGSTRPINLQYFACIAASVPSNVLVRTEIARLMGGFPEDPVFRGPAAGEDACFKMALGNFPTHHLPFPYHGHRVTPGNHLDRFLDRSEFRDGRVVVTRPTGPEADGSLGAAIQRYHGEVARRIAARDSSAKAADRVPPTAVSFSPEPDFAPLRDRFAGLGEVPSAAEAYALYQWAARGEQDGEVVQIGCASASLTCWLAEGCRVGGRGKVAAVDPFSPARSTAAIFGSAQQIFLDRLRDKGLDDHVEIHRGQPGGVAWTWKRPIRLLVIDGASSLIASGPAFEEWLVHMVKDGTVAFHGFGIRPEVSRLYDEVLAAGRLREVFARDGVRILVFR